MIDKNKYSASAMNRLANDHSYRKFEEALTTVLLKIDGAAEAGQFECWIYEQDIDSKNNNCSMADISVELRKLGYDTTVERDKNDFELHVSWG